jgi:hypothetical protein
MLIAITVVSIIFGLFLIGVAVAICKAGSMSDDESERIYQSLKDSSNE